MTQKKADADRRQTWNESSFGGSKKKLKRSEGKALERALFTTRKKAKRLEDKAWSEFFAGF
jgi:hypothetical protein